MHLVYKPNVRSSVKVIIPQGPPIEQVNLNSEDSVSNPIQGYRYPGFRFYSFSEYSSELYFKLEHRCFLSNPFLLPTQNLHFTLQAT
jgi:hypothetical protein